MARHVVCAVDDIEVGGRKLVSVKGRPVVIFEAQGAFYGLFNRCPHEGGSQAHGNRVGRVTADKPGGYTYDRPGDFIRCPWHGWEFDIRTGKSYCDPETMATRRFMVSETEGCNLTEADLVAETVKVTVDGRYLVVEL